ncbi:esterase [Massilia sp. WF1]|uniref:SGNH/GDSL hydrolase family protein n=1 Tax=unclassified Massilia TaxID=2609279 RepID=UPI000692166A|nr:MULTISPECIES: SGNH/GDSL hydrolase family protein [unclassified Massilia]ALK99013.1 esterase [Massilia sp. WG5]KNZ67633.1 esterase [Massilia sp. WF1]
MRKTSFALALLTAAVLTACGGNGPSGGDQTPKTKFSNQITFGDSLSDVGTYAVGAVAALGGGQYTINGNNTSVSPELTGKNYTTLIAAQLGLPAPCAAQTGLLGTASAGFSVPVTDHPECFNYAQGGARVTNPIGPGNKALDKPGAAVSLGQMTVPVVTQIANHLKKTGGKFKSDELVIVMAGGNDVLEQLGELSAGATTAGGQALAQSLVAQLAPGTTNPQTGAAAIGAAIQAEAAKGSAAPAIITAAITAAAQNGNTAAVANAAAIGAKAGADAQAAGLAYSAAHGADLVKALGTAGAELGALVKTQIVANGAGYVVVNNLPDVSISPSAKAQSADTQKLIQAMVAAFNDTLKAAVAGEPKVLYVDLAAVSRDQATNPAPYGLTNTTTPACDLSPAKNPLGSSLVCNKNNLIAGDVSHYMFADSVHPTPFEYALIARYVLEQMTVKGWL